MTIYLDTEYKCHVQPAAGRMAVEAPFFDGKCAAFIEGYRYLPAGHRWTRADGVVFRGEMAAPWKDCALLLAAQADYENMQDMEAALRLLGLSPTEEVTDNG